MLTESTCREVAVLLAELMDGCTRGDGQWSGADVCDALANLIDEWGGWARCPTHDVYAASKPSCPFCDEDECEEENE